MYLTLVHASLAKFICQLIIDANFSQKKIRIKGEGKSSPLAEKFSNPQQSGVKQAVMKEIIVSVAKYF